jgi:hypothetical protein
VEHVHWEANWYLISYTSFIVLITCSLVLDEAHKYLTNADANRFTKTICSVIRQQRHLAARVIVSTQEPTVVPASVLDLLSWVVCHRFSSPSWVKHLMHHICVEEVESNKADDDLPVPSDWGQRVMVLRTGEALLYSPASLFLSQRGRLATLSSGYAVIKTRPRLTRDGGASLLATQGDSSVALNNLPTPTASNSSTSPPPIASVLGINLRPSSSTPSNSHVGIFMPLICCSDKFSGFDGQGCPGGRTHPAYFTRTSSFV